MPWISADQDYQNSSTRHASNACACTFVECEFVNWFRFPLSLELLSLWGWCSYSVCGVVRRPYAQTHAVLGMPCRMSCNGHAGSPHVCEQEEQQHASHVRGRSMHQALASGAAQVLLAAARCSIFYHDLIYYNVTYYSIMYYNLYYAIPELTNIYSRIIELLVRREALRCGEGPSRLARPWPRIRPASSGALFEKERERERERERAREGERAWENLEKKRERERESSHFGSSAFAWRPVPPPCIGGEARGCPGAVPSGELPLPFPAVLDLLLQETP